MFCQITSLILRMAGLLCRYVDYRFRHFLQYLFHSQRYDAMIPQKDRSVLLVDVEVVLVRVLVGVCACVIVCACACVCMSECVTGVILSLA